MIKPRELESDSGRDAWDMITAAATGDTGGAAGTGGAGSGSSPGLAFTGTSGLGPLVGLGALLVVAGAVVRRRLRRWH